MPNKVSQLFFCALPSEVAVLFNSHLSRSPFLGQVVNLDLLLLGYLLKNNKIICVELESFLGLLKMRKLRTVLS